MIDIHNAGGDIITLEESTSLPTPSNETSFFFYNSTDSKTVSGNNYTWVWNEIPYGDVGIIVFYGNVTREYFITNNETTYNNLTATFEENVAPFSFYIYNIYNLPIEEALMSVYKTNGTEYQLVTQRYSQSDGYIYEIYLQYNIPVIINLTHADYQSKSFDFTPYLSTIQPTQIRLDEGESNVTFPQLYDNLTVVWNPANDIIVGYNTSMSFGLVDSSATLINTTFRAYMQNYSGEYSLYNESCVDTASCSFSHDMNLTSTRYNYYVDVIAENQNYTFTHSYVTNSTGGLIINLDLPNSTGLNVQSWKFIVFIVLCVLIGMTYPFFGAGSLLLIPLITSPAQILTAKIHTMNDVLKNYLILHLKLKSNLYVRSQ